MKQQHMFSNKMIAGILIPVVLEQLLNSIMGTADTMMVSNIGSAAISAVSLVDSINILVIQAFFGTGSRRSQLSVHSISDNRIKRWRMNLQGTGVIHHHGAISIAVMCLCLGFKKPLLRLIFGSVEADVMRASQRHISFIQLFHFRS